MNYFTITTIWVKDLLMNINCIIWYLAQKAKLTAWNTDVEYLLISRWTNMIHEYLLSYDTMLPVRLPSNICISQLIFTHYTLPYKFYMQNVLSV